MIPERIKTFLENQKGQNRLFVDTNEILKALENKDVTLHTKIISRVRESNGESKTVETTPGRMILADSLPNNEKINFSIIIIKLF